LVSQLREDLLLCSSYLPLGLPNELYLQAINEFSGAIAGRGGRRLLQGESLTHNLLLCFSFALFYFCLHRFIKNTKN
jgi:hypothetical protein